MNNDKYQLDIKDNKVKQGALMKQSRHIKQWKERWMVLTKTHFYSFEDKTLSKNPTEIVALKDVETTKSYYKDQKKPYCFRVQSPDVNLHFSAKSSDQKWAWMTAIQKMIERVIHPEDKPNIQNDNRQTVKISTAVRQTLQKNEQKDRKKSMDTSNNILKRLKNSINNKTNQFKYQPQKINVAQTQPILSEIKQKVEQVQQEKKQKQQQLNIIQKIKQVIIEKIVQVEKIIQVDKIVYVEKNVEPQQKIAQKQAQNQVINQQKQQDHTQVQKQIQNQKKISEKSSLVQVLKKVTTNHTNNPKPLVNFVVFLLTSKTEQFQSQVLQYCFDPQSMRFFSEVFLLMMNEQRQEQNINTYLKFLMVLYQNCNQYFYSSDFKELVGILLRQIQMNRSEFNQYLILSLLKQLTNKDWWLPLDYRRDQLATFIKQIQAISDTDNKDLANEVLQKL